MSVAKRTLLIAAGAVLVALVVARLADPVPSVVAAVASGVAAIKPARLISAGRAHPAG